MNCPISFGLRGTHKTIGFIDKLNHEMTSYKTRQSSYGDPTGCMPETRVKILEDLEAWALNADSSKVYWMIGMAGIGKSTISHTFCEILEAKNMLGGNFFGSRASDKTSNARLIIPVIAHALARSSPLIAFEVVKAIKNDPHLAELSYHNVDEQFKQLIYNPIRTAASKMVKIYKVVIIDAVDECINLEVVSSFIKLVLKSASEIPLKIFIASRDEYRTRKAFKSGNSVGEYFYLHDIETDVSRMTSAGISRHHWRASRMMTVRNGPFPMNFPVSSSVPAHFSFMQRLPFVILPTVANSTSLDFPKWQSKA